MVVVTSGEVSVFNLVVGESAVFIANEFLARGKPPPIRYYAPQSRVE